MYKEYLEELKYNLEELKCDMLDDKKLMHITDDELIKDIANIENSIENIEDLLNKNNRI
tara:strand:- start:1282 stop:1458 length:177 start_codon:yes stop_codon:yes gene_type:complete